MSSTFESLANRGNCQKCGYLRDLVRVKSNGQEYELCRPCATNIQVGRVQ